MKATTCARSFSLPEKDCQVFEHQQFGPDFRKTTLDFGKNHTIPLLLVLGVQVSERGVVASVVGQDEIFIRCERGSPL